MLIPTLAPSIGPGGQKCFISDPRPSNFPHAPLAVAWYTHKCFLITLLAILCLFFTCYCHCFFVCVKGASGLHPCSHFLTFHFALSEHENLLSWNALAQSIFSHAGNTWIEAESGKGWQSSEVEPRTPLAWAANALPLSHDSQTTTNPYTTFYSVCQVCDWGIQYHLCSTCRGLLGLVVVWLLWHSGRALRCPGFDFFQLPAFSLLSIFATF